MVSDLAMQALRKQILLNIFHGLKFWALPPGPSQSKQQQPPPPPPDIYPPPERKYENPSLVQFPKMWLIGTVFWYCVLPPRKESVSLWNKSAINKNRLIIQIVQLPRAVT